MPFPLTPADWLGVLTVVVSAVTAAPLASSTWLTGHLCPDRVSWAVEGEEGEVHLGTQVVRMWYSEVGAW